MGGFLLTSLLAAGSFAADGNVVAQGEHHRVTTIDMDARMLGAPRPAAVGALNNPLMLRKMAGSLFVQRAIADEARAMGLDKDPVLKAKARELVDGLLFKERMRRLDEQPTPDLSDVAREKFDANPDAWADPEKVAIAHILVRTHKLKQRVRSDEEALKIARDLIAKLKKGANFAELAQRYSDDPETAPRGGVLGVYKRGQLGRPFEEVAFGLDEKNDISEPVHSDYGYHIIKLYRHIPKRERSYDEIKDELIAKLEAEFRAQRRADYLSKIREEEHLRIDDAALKAFAERKKRELGVVHAHGLIRDPNSGSLPVPEKSASGGGQ
jgi:peptidyl-prolyl cis-trans isomerase C